LLGDATLRGIQTTLRSAFSRVITGAGNATTLNSLGISFQRDGTLTLDSSKLSAALADPNANVAAFFASGARTTDSQVSFLSNTSPAKAGTYPVTVTQLATQGMAAGSVAAATTITAGVNDKLTLAVDGIVTTITLGAGTYTAATLVNE